MALIGVEELAARLNDPELRIADVRWYLGQPGKGRAEYRGGHIPGAVFVDLDADLSGPGDGRHPLPDPRAFAARLGQLGFGSDHFIVAYDDAGGGVAARLWWMLDNLGHSSVALLDGGLPAWRAAGLSVETAAPSYPPAELRLGDRWSGIVDRAYVKAQLGSFRVLDARAGERYRGEVEPIDPVAGHIPTAVSAPAAGNLDADGRFLSPARLRERFKSLGATSGEVVTTCGSGVTACQTSLAMRVAGLPDPVLYPGSFSDWATAGLPVAVGADPGEVEVVD